MAVVYKSHGQPWSRSRIDAIPFAHPELEKWRTNFTGVQALHKPTNMLVTGAVDDLWENARGELIVVDYKSTLKAEYSL
jgi:ATP-dependent exoDNAse (exonuclease V) beta subunit